VLGVERSRFAVVPLAHDPARSAAEPPPEAELRARHGLAGRRVVLCVAAKRPHKNQAVLVEAAALLGADVAIVLAGHPEQPYDGQLRALAAARGAEGHLCFLDYVPDAGLEGLWRLAAAAALPTLGEGFGIPLLEAFAHGVPVAASDIPVLREVGADVPHYFDAHDPAAAARAIEAAMRDEHAGVRGRARAAEFSWEATAAGVHAAYERAMGAR
jgi:glycosyltransferase involved in cell wall biosynthesis